MDVSLTCIYYSSLSSFFFLFISLYFLIIYWKTTTVIAKPLSHFESKNETCLSLQYHYTLIRNNIKHRERGEREMKTTNLHTEMTIMMAIIWMRRKKTDTRRLFTQKLPSSSLMWGESRRNLLSSSLQPWRDFFSSIITGKLKFLLTLVEMEVFLSSRRDLPKFEKIFSKNLDFYSSVCRQKNLRNFLPKICQELSVGSNQISFDE